MADPESNVSSSDFDSSLTLEDLEEDEHDNYELDRLPDGSVVNESDFHHDLPKRGTLETQIGVSQSLVSVYGRPCSPEKAAELCPPGENGDIGGQVFHAELVTDTFKVQTSFWGVTTRDKFFKLPTHIISPHTHSLNYTQFLLCLFNLLPSTPERGSHLILKNSVSKPTYSTPSIPPRKDPSNQDDRYYQ